MLFVDVDSQIAVQTDSAGCLHSRLARARPQHSLNTLVLALVTCKLLRQSDRESIANGVEFTLHGIMHMGTFLLSLIGFFQILGLTAGG